MGTFSALLALCERNPTGGLPFINESDAELWYFLWHASERTVEQTAEMQVIWDPVALIMTSRYSKCIFLAVKFLKNLDPVSIGSTQYSEGSFVRRFFSPKPFEVAMVRRTYGPKVLYSEVPLLRKLLCSEDSIFRKALHYMDFMLRRFFSPKFI